MNAKYIIFILIVIVLGAGAYVFFGQKNVFDSNDKPLVVTSFYPLYFFASEIGGERAEVKNITPAGVEPHEYEPTPQDLTALEKSDVIVLNGEGFEPWGESVVENIGAGKRIVIAGEGLATLITEEEEGGAAGEKRKEIIDPHVWLSPALAQRMAERIRDGIIAIDPQNETYYRANADNLVSELEGLDVEFKEGLASCARRDIVTSHAAFAHIARDYNLNQVAISGLSPEEEPSARELAEIVQFTRAHDTRFIFFETLVPSSLSETIAKEIGAQTLVLNPLEGLTDEEVSLGKNYLSVMEQNLAHLKIALQCR